MDQQDANNMSQWLQELLRLLQDTRSQLIDMRNENRQVLDELKAVSARVDQKDSDIMRMIEALKGQIDVARGDITAAKNAVESTNSHLDSKISDLKSEIHQVRNIVR